MPEPSQAPDTPHAPSLVRPCKLVVLGASAGGLDALCRVFERLPPDTGAAFVVVQHL